MKQTTRNATLATAAALLIMTVGCTTPEAADGPEAPDGGHLGTDHHIVKLPGDIEWRDGPPSLPAGAQFAVLQGDLAEREFIALRLSFPAGYAIPPHWHEAVEHVTIISGSLHVGMGDVFDEALATELPAGSFAVVPNTRPHFAFTTDEPVTFQLHSIGPWGITYVDPADDPRGA